MTTADIELRIKTEFAAAAAAAASGHVEAADQHWRTYVGLLELKMGRIGSIERLTPDPRVQVRVQP